MTGDWQRIFFLADRLGKKLRSSEVSLSVAESCTGGGICYAVTEIPGSSTWFLGGITAYSNELKHSQLGVNPELIGTQGAVCLPVVEAMALGVSNLTGSKVAISTSGIAGPDGGTTDKPVGTVCFGWFIEGTIYSDTQCFSGDRESVRLQSIEHALTRLLDLL